MVGHLVRLKLRLLRNGLKRRPSVLIGLVVGIVYGSGAVLLACAALVALAFEPVTHTGGALLTLGGSVLVLAWVVLPLLAFGTDPTLDPRRFATYPIRSRDLALGLAASGLVSLPALATALIVGTSVFTWHRTLLSVLVALVAAVAILATVILASRVATAWASAILQTRRGRDIAVVGTLVVVIGYAVGASRLSSAAAEGEDFLNRLIGLGDLASWTPMGWGWAAAWKVAEGDVGGGLLRLALALALVAVLALAWLRAARSIVESPRGLAAVSGPGRSVGLGWFGRLPGTPFGAVAARSLTMWRRDPRYQMSAVILPFVPLILFIIQAGSGSEGGDLTTVMPLFLSFLMGFSAHNDVAYDGTAFALHVASAVPGWADRLGRLVPYLVVWGVTAPVYLVVALARSGRWELAPALVGGSVVLALGGWGISCLTSALVPYGVPGPTDSPFSTPPGSIGASFLAQTVFSLICLALSTPALGLGLWQMFGGPTAAGWGALAYGVVVGPLALWLGATRGGRYLDTNGDRLLEKLVRAA